MHSTLFNVGRVNGSVWSYVLHSIFLEYLQAMHRSRNYPRVSEVTMNDRVKNRCELQWRHNGRDSVSNHQPYDCLFNGLFKRRSKKTSKLRVTGFCAVNSPETGEFPAQMASNAENVSIWWRHHGNAQQNSRMHNPTAVTVSTHRYVGAVNWVRSMADFYVRMTYLNSMYSFLPTLALTKLASVRIELKSKLYMIYVAFSALLLLTWVPFH